MTPSPVITTTVACYEGFDLDLCSWHEDAKLRLESLGDYQVYAIGEADGERLRSLTYWNGVGCLCYSRQPNIEPDKDGWLRIGSLTCDDAVIRVPVSHIIRHAFVQGYPVSLDGSKWIPQQSVCVRSVNGHLRGWHKLSDDEWRKVCDDVFAFVDQAAGTFLTMKGYTG